MLNTGQEDPGNPKAIQAGGCYLWSIWTHVERILHRSIFTSTKIISDEYQKLLSNGLRDIAQDATIENGDNVFAQYGIITKQIMDPLTGTVFVSPNFPLTDKHVAIDCHYWALKKYTHFDPIDNDKNMILDPIARGANTIKNGFVHSMRVYEVIGLK